MSNQFYLWLQGFNAALGGRSPTKEEWQLILDKLEEYNTPVHAYRGLLGEAVVAPSPRPYYNPNSSAKP